MTTTIYAIASALLFALTFFLRKQALRSLPIYFALSIELLFGFLITLLFLINSHSNRKELLSSKNGILFAIAAGIVMVLGIIFNYLALKNDDLSKVISITSPAQIIFGLIIGLFLLSENLNITKVVGIVFSIIGIALITRVK